MLTLTDSIVATQAVKDSANIRQISTAALISRAMQAISDEARSPRCLTEGGIDRSRCPALPTKRLHIEGTPHDRPDFPALLVSAPWGD